MNRSPYPRMHLAKLPDTIVELTNTKVYTHEKEVDKREILLRLAQRKLENDKRRSKYDCPGHSYIRGDRSLTRRTIMFKRSLHSPCLVSGRSIGYQTRAGPYGGARNAGVSTACPSPVPVDVSCTSSGHVLDQQCRREEQSVSICPPSRRQRCPAFGREVHVLR